MQELDNWGLLDNWITARADISRKRLEWHPNYSIIDLDSLEFHPEAYRRYRTDSALRLATGNRLVLTISGGVDSQAMLQSFTEAGLDFDIATMVFERDYNSHDVEFARATAARYGKKLVEIPLEVFKFLQFRLWDYAEKYSCNSPQFACHHWFYEQLLDRGYDCIISGGQTWFPAAGNRWLWTNTPARHAWWTFSQINQAAVNGNFLGSSWQLNCAIALNYALHEVQVKPLTAEADPESFRLEEIRQYQKKVSALRKFGFNVVAQENKFTGFEKVKAYFNNLTGDPYAFENRFRWPLQDRWPITGGHLAVTDEFSNRLLDIKQSTPSLKT